MDERFSPMYIQVSPSPHGHAFPRLKLRFKPSLVQVCWIAPIFGLWVYFLIQPLPYVWISRGCLKKFTPSKKLLCYPDLSMVIIGHMASINCCLVAYVCGGTIETQRIHFELQLKILVIFVRTTSKGLSCDFVASLFILQVSHSALKIVSCLCWLAQVCGTASLPLTDPSSRAVPLTPQQWREKLEARALLDARDKRLADNIDTDLQNMKKVLVLDVRNGMLTVHCTFSPSIHYLLPFQLTIQICTQSRI